MLAHRPLLALQAAKLATSNTSKANLQGTEQNTKVHLTTHLQAVCWAAGFENETVTTGGLCSVSCSTDA